MSSRRTALVGLVALGLGCGEASPRAVSESAPVSTASTATTVSTARTEVAVPAPAPTDGLAVTRCTLDGPPIAGTDPFRSIGPIARASDGSLWLIDDGRRIRRYVVASGETCALELDTSVGDGGLLALGDGPGAVPQSLSADASGHVFVASATGGAHRLTGGRVDYRCDAVRGDLSVAPSGAVGLSVFGRGPIRRVGLTDSGCTVEDWPALEPFDDVGSVSVLGEARALVGGHSDRAASPHLARLYHLDGTPEGPRFGDTGGALAAPGHFCSVHLAVPCGDRLCVLDGNCRRLRIFSADREAVDALDLATLTGLSYPWFPGLTRPEGGRAYLTAIQRREGEGPARYDTFVYRLDGL